MRFNDSNGVFDWTEKGEKEDGYYFILKDKLNKVDYDVILVKDDGNIMVNGDHIDQFPFDIANAINTRIKYFNAMNIAKQQVGHHSAPKAADKKSEKKDDKKSEKKDDKKEADKKEEKKSK